ncbi:hypothetical protein HS1genome_1779 [Sulfodiicoccus acidiphilus]|uniref:DUF4352 domain-containing protein n=1 Tax=Sulfodiicoccus acidiphilus TaxID=1670455 RepID=A0A348B5D8_9CREN|nr:DUF4352 domain-containing protein [Sulfodiicoccus acidiphilus]BBD73390.1 hypothetical protein HS1genome_1779 [Sulfodiicoccus acidiphilus]
MPSLALIIVVAVVIIAGVGGTVIVLQHISVKHTIYTNVTVPSTQNSSSTPTTHPVSGQASGLTIQVSSVIDAKALAQYRGLGGLKYELLFVTITNDLNSPTVVTPGDFALVGSDGQTYNEVALSAFQFSTLETTPIQAGQSVNGFLAFQLPYGVQPRSLQYKGTTISLAGVKVQYLSVLNVTPVFNDSDVVASSGSQGMLIAGVNGVPAVMQLEIYNNHSSVPVELVGVTAQGPVELARSPTLHVSLPPRGSYALTLNLSLPDSSVYGSAEVDVLTSLNSSAYSGSVRSLVNDTVLAELQGLTGQSYLSYNVTVSYDGGAASRSSPRTSRW